MTEENKENLRSKLQLPDEDASDFNDPLVESLNSDSVEQDISTFTNLLVNQADESSIHTFLSTHSYFFNGIIRLYGASPLYSKIKLGNDFELDFACFDAGSVGPEWRLIEIENAKKKLLTTSGEFTAVANHSIQQVRDWQIFIHENLDFTQKLMPSIQYPRGYVFVGRRSEYTRQAVKRIRKFNDDHNYLIEIHSLDWFISSAKSVLALLKDGNKGNWPLPMEAFSHSDLKKGLSDPAQHYIDHFTQKGRNTKYPEEFLLERKYHNDRIDDDDYI